MLSRRSLAALALVPVLPAWSAAGAPPDPIIPAIARVGAARQRWDAAALEGSREWHAANAALDQAQDRLFATTPRTPAGLAALLEHARTEGYDAGQVLEVVERSIGTMVDHR